MNFWWRAPSGKIYLKKLLWWMWQLKWNSVKLETFIFKVELTRWDNHFVRGGNVPDSRQVHAWCHNCNQSSGTVNLINSKSSWNILLNYPRNTFATSAKFIRKIVHFTTHWGHLRNSEITSHEVLQLFLTGITIADGKVSRLMNEEGKIEWKL